MKAENATVLKSLYLAALEPGRWADFLGETRAALRSPVSGFSVFDVELRSNRIWLTSGLDEGSLREYDEHFAARNPRTRLLRGLPRGGWFRCHEHFDDRFVRRNEFYQDFLAKRDLRYAMAGVMVRTRRFTVHFGAWRDMRAGEFDGRDLETVNALTPHLQSVLSYAALAGRQEFSSPAGEDEDSAVVIVAAGRRVLSMNAIAEKRFRGMTSQEVKVVNGVLEFTSARLNADVDRHLDACRRLFRPRRAEALSEDNRFSVLAEPLLSERGRRLRLIPLDPERIIWIPDSDAPLAKLVLDVEQGIPSPRVQAGSMRLTAAEGEVARLVCKGLTLAEIARQRGVQRSTVKSQIDSLFHKSGARTQKALVARLMQAGLNDD